jgi:hypothetical protein
MIADHLERRPIMKRFRNLISRRPARRKSPARRLMVDGLESRELMSGYTLGPLVQVSGPSLYAGSTADNLQADQILLNSEDENQLAVDPINPNHLVALWQGDESTVGNRGQNLGVTFDGGNTWTVAPLPGVTQVTGGALQSTADPWIAFAPNGDLYASCLAFTSPQQFFGTTAEDNVLVLKSTDGGLTWGAPIGLHDNTDQRAFNDKESLTTDPTDSRYAYMAWDYFSVPSGFAERNERPVIGFTGVKAPAVFTRTTDGGRTWEPVRTIYDPGANALAFGHELVGRPDGALLDFFAEDLANKNNDGGTKFEVNLSLLVSTDKGQTWQNGRPIRAAKMNAVPLSDPDNGIPIDDTTFQQEEPDVAVDPHSGYLYAVWRDGSFSGGRYSSIAFSMSTDGGLTWSKPIQINKTPTDIPAGDQQAWLPSVKVADDGTVAVTYYDFRNNDGNPGLATDYWAVFGKPTTPTALTDPSNWGNELRLTDRSFDLEKTLFQSNGDTVPGLFLGDYEGLKAVGNDFVATFCQPVSPSDPKSIFFRRIISTASLAAPSVMARHIVTISNTVPTSADPFIRSSPPSVLATSMAKSLAALDHTMPVQPPMRSEAASTSRSLPERNGAAVQVGRADAELVDYLLEAGRTGERDFSRSRRKHRAVDPAGIAPSEDWLVTSMSPGEAATD